MPPSSAKPGISLTVSTAVFSNPRSRLFARFFSDEQDMAARELMRSGTAPQCHWPVGDALAAHGFVQHMAKRIFTDDAKCEGIAGFGLPRPLHELGHVVEDGRLHGILQVSRALAADHPAGQRQ
jgi:hypothetical protein